MSKVKSNDKEKHLMTRGDMMERRSRLSHAYEEVRYVLNTDREYGYIDDGTFDLLQEALYQVIMAINDNNTIWHIQDGEKSFFENESGFNDFTIWNLEITSPTNIGFTVMGRDHDFRP